MRHARPARLPAALAAGLLSVLLAGCGAAPAASGEGMTGTPGATSGASDVSPVGPTASEASTGIGTPASARPIDTEVQVGPKRLGGTLTLPGEGVPRRKVVVVLISGSGPNKRDAEVGDVPIRPFRDIANGLAAYGIASLRYDKRTSVEGAFDSNTLTVQQEYLEDAAAAIRLLGERPETRADKVIVAGHSLGGMVLPNIVEANPGVAGGVIMSGTPRTFWEVTLDQQISSIEDSPGGDKAARIAAAKAEHARAAALTDTNAEPILDFAAPYIVSYNKLRSGEVARRLTVPLLVLHGSQDGNVAAEPNFAAWKTVLAGKDATFHLYPEDNHFLLTKDDLSLDQHVDGRVIHDMVAWLQRWP